ncbi:MAG TPA: DinB family protein [Holophaga sp.]|nr:DinB family protein [Holophaga sp.]
MTPEARAGLLLSFARGPAHLGEAIRACPADALDFKPSPSAWSVRDIVWHMAESELHAYCRGRFIISEPGVTILPYGQDRWAETLEPGNHPLDEALELFRLLRELMARQLRRLPEAAWRQSVRHPERGEVTLERWLEIYEGHLTVHLAQIQRTLEAWDRSAAGN